ncbi:hypothetical protein H2198_006549 [Neophaeococcomyces mojaviensis]|uniref:Uncharacterized protein n=1 Tax=Neophaeococcomyces mojaviensis TaxID=3383035 RepID=A0ACC3A2H4_9EURO|nr:hypothetical protein H2198_006549 [Knufia sp. JES_112]
MSAEANVPAPTNADPALPPSDLSASKSNEIKHSSLPISPEMPGTEGKNNAVGPIHFPSLPSDFKSVLSTTDDTVTRLSKLLKTSGGLTSFLSTLNYALYIAAYAHMAAPTRAQVLTFISKYVPGRAVPKIAPGALQPSEPSTPLLPLALTIGDLRTTLRLTSLIPMYVLLKTLIKTRNTAKDKIGHTIQLAQCLCYMGFQLLENVAHLTNKTVINTNWTNARFARLGGSARLGIWSCRSWMAGVTLEFFRLFREAQVARESGSAYSKMNQEEKREADKKWWAELFVATSWYPMAVHYSVDGGIGLNLGMVGCAGFFANLGNFLKAWEGTR